MAQTIQIRMSRQENSPWGFRLHGGVDFGSPLIIQKVNFRSLSESAGLQTGDVIVAINGSDITGCRHKEAQEAIVRAGNNFQITIQRGAVAQQTWKPQVTPVGEMPTQPTQPGQVFTKTSLAATKQEDSHWDVKHNQTPRGFASPQAKQNGGPHINPPKGQQYNNPSGLYSEQAIQDVLNQQAETLATGVKGINFKQFEKPEKSLPSNSEVLKVLQEQESPQKGIAGLAELQEDRGCSSNQQSTFKSVAAPITKPRPEGQPTGPPLSVCAQCGRLITGVFCKVRGQPLHAECFTCAVCSCPLKNVGYFAVGDKLYCEPHARAAKASQQIGQQIPIAPPQAKPVEQNFHQHQQQQAKNVQQNYSQQQQSKENWDQILNSNTAGMASNAEDFTKQFMSQMFGKETSGTVGQPKYPTTSSPMANRPSSGQGYHNNQGSGTSQTQGILKVTNTDDIITTSNRPKKDTNKNNVCHKSDSSDLANPPQCFKCKSFIDRGPFITALGRTWCPGHFICSQASCGRSLQEIGFVEEQGHLYCEDCYGKYLAPDCEKCRKKILGNCLKAMSKTFHPECFVCAYCGKIFANSPFYLEDGLPYCEEDWNELFTTKCVSCGFPIEAGDRWVEALNNNYHSQCFNCTLCKKNLEGKGFFVKAGKPFCKSHARMGV